MTWPRTPSVLFCRIVDVGGCTWGRGFALRALHRQLRPQLRHCGDGQHRQPSRASRRARSGQHIVADNVFEGRTFYNRRPGGYIVRATCGAHTGDRPQQPFRELQLLRHRNHSGGDARICPPATTRSPETSWTWTAVGEDSRPRTAVHCWLVGCDHQQQPDLRAWRV